jgi:dUTP pyrophosphatase
VILVNHGTERVRIEVGDRIAQLLIQTVERATFVRADTLDDSVRGQSGFGSTGR